MLVVDMTAAAQAHRVYDAYLAELADTSPEAGPAAVSPAPKGSSVKSQ